MRQMYHLVKQGKSINSGQLQAHSVKEVADGAEVLLYTVVKARFSRRLNKKESGYQLTSQSTVHELVGSYGLNNSAVCRLN
jgi:hypothetical protein